MERSPNQETVCRLCAFLPADVRRGILGLLLASYGDERQLAQEVGCRLATLRAWTAGENSAPDDTHMPAILSLALVNCPEAEDLLREKLWEAVERLCIDLGLSQEDGEGDMTLLLDALDDKSRQILWHLWWHRHVQLAELVELIGASSDMEVLSRLREVINPEAERILGQPILEFRQVGVDPETGGKVLFSWWLKPDGLSLEPKGKDWLPLRKRRGPLVDLFDEKDHIMIIAELPPSVRPTKEAEVACKSGFWQIRLNKEVG